ncbi:MAG: TfoX/Sxy family protein [Burkholderiales bacterium]|nr:TfoX/Sxy family protein [Burkholderiales bacterium]
MRIPTSISNQAVRQFADELAYRLEPLGDIEVKRFFGGHALRYAGVQFAMVMKGSVYFHVDDSTRANYQKHQSQAFHYVSKTKDIIVQRYFEVPPAILESDAELMTWARESIRTVKINHTTRKKS